MDPLKVLQVGTVAELASHKTIRCVHCNGVFDHVRKYVAHLKQRGVGEPSECDQIRRGLV